MVRVKQTHGCTLALSRCVGKSSPRILWPSDETRGKKKKKTAPQMEAIKSRCGQADRAYPCSLFPKNSSRSGPGQPINVCNPSDLCWMYSPAPPPPSVEGLPNGTTWYGYVLAPPTRRRNPLPLAKQSK